MTGIIFLILKIIGIIVAILLGVILLVCTIVCFVPITYFLQGSIQETKESIQAKVQVNWLFRIIRIRLYFREGNTLQYECYIFGLKFKSGELGGEEHLPDNEEVEELKSKEDNPIPTNDSMSPNEPIPPSDSKSPNNPMSPNKESVGKQASAQEVSQATTQENREAQEEASEHKQNIFEKISSKIRELCDKIKTFIEMKDKVVDFYYHPVHQRTLQKLKKEGIYHLRKLKPRVFEATGVVGFQSPDQTGYMAAGLSMLLPLYGEHIDIQPEFEEARMDVQGKVAGKVRVYPLLLSLIRLVFSRDFRRTISDIKKLQVTKS